MVSGRLGTIDFRYPTLANSFYEDCRLIVDGTDIPITSPTSSFELNKKWLVCKCKFAEFFFLKPVVFSLYIFGNSYSYKFRRPGLRYVAAVDILSDKLVYYYGPCPAATGAKSFGLDMSWSYCAFSVLFSVSLAKVKFRC